jgi:uncharacterized repeat protein (TIGR02543 family)
MSNEELAMRKEKRRMTKILICSFVLCCLILGCLDLSLPLEPVNTWGDPPDGKGSFSLSIGMTDAARTILPINHPVENDFALYSLKFTLKSGGAVTTEDREPAEISAPVNLEPGTYTLEVTGYLDTAKNLSAARGNSKDDIVINARETTTGTVILKAIDNEGQGTFKYTVTFLPNVISPAKIKITPLGATGTPPVQEIDLTSGVTGTLNLSTGDYNVVFTLTRNDGEKLVWRELLRIYANLVSEFNISFTDNYFSITAYTVTFMDGSTVLTDYTRNNVSHGSTIIRPATNPTKTGYTFDNWYTTNALNTLFDFTNTQIISDTTVYAKFNINTYAVTFNADGGIPAPPPQNIAYGQKVTSVTVTKTGNTLDGWYTEAGFVNKWDFNVDTVSGAMTLYAKWTPITYAVTFNTNGGTPVPTTQNINHGGKVTEPPTTMIKTDYVFDGWYKEAGLNNKWDFSMDTVTATITLYAKWIHKSEVPLSTIDDISRYLDSQPYGDVPVPLKLSFDLGNMTSPSSNWQRLLILLNDMSRYVNLDLSGCTMSGGPAFNAGAGEGAGRIKSIILPTVATSISANAFSNYWNLIEVTLHAGITTIGNDAFNYDGITLVTCYATTPPTLGTNVFTNNIQQIKVPSASVTAYRGATNWSAYSTKITAIP